MDVPAPAAIGSVGVDNDEAVLICKSGVLSSAEVGLCGAGTIMHGDDDGGVAGDLVGYVDVRADVCGVGAEAGDLLQGGAEDAEREGGETDEDAEES